MPAGKRWAWQQGCKGFAGLSFVSKRQADMPKSLRAVLLTHVKAKRTLTDLSVKMFKRKDEFEKKYAKVQAAISNQAINDRAAARLTVEAKGCNPADGAKAAL